MGMDYQLDRAWVNAAKGVRQCQKADKVLEKGRVDSATDHYAKALKYFSTSVDHLAKAEVDAEIKAGHLVDDGNQQLQKAIDSWVAGNVGGAERHYNNALDKYDEALDLID